MIKKYIKYIVLSTILLQSNNAIASNKCKRPSWKLKYSKSLECQLPFNHYLLYKNSHNGVEIEKKDGICKVKNGEWKVLDVNETIIYITDPTLLNVDHIIPYNYFVKKLGCKKAHKLYQNEYNLMLTTEKYNKQKNNKICANKKMCDRQYNVCLTFNILYDNLFDCDRDFFIEN